MERQKKTDEEKRLSDEEIIELYWTRNERAIEATDEKYGKYLFTIAYNIVHDRLDCEECLNDTYLGAWNKIPPQRPNAFQIFLSKIMRNIAVDKFRKNTAAKRVPSEMTTSLDELDDCIGSSSLPDEEYEVNEKARVMNEYLRSLDRRREFVFICRYYYSDHVSDIARMLGVSESTVARELVAIREGLREALEKEGYRNE